MFKISVALLYTMAGSNPFDDPFVARNNLLVLHHLIPKIIISPFTVLSNQIIESSINHTISFPDKIYKCLPPFDSIYFISSRYSTKSLVICLLSNNISKKFKTHAIPTAILILCCSVRWFISLIEYMVDFMQVNHNIHYNYRWSIITYYPTCCVDMFQFTITSYMLIDIQ